MLCQNALRVFAGLSRSRVIQRLPHCRNYRVEARAARKLLHRSGLEDSKRILQLSGVRMLHTSDWRRQRPENENRGNDDDDERERMLSALKTAVGVVAVPLLLILIYSGFGGDGGGGGGGGGGGNSTRSALDRAQRPGQPVGEIQWNDFYQNLLLKGEVQEIVVHAGVNRATAILHPGAMYKGTRINTQIVRLITANVDNIEAKVRDAEAQMGVKLEHMIPITYERKSQSMGQVIGIFLILGVLALGYRGFQAMSRNMRASMGEGGSNPFSKFTKAEFTLIDPFLKGSGGTKFKDVAGLKEPKVEVMEFVDFLMKPDKYRELGAKPPKGAILFGPPGCGKTMLAKAVANEASVPFLSMNGSEFIEMIGGLGASRVRNLFAEARKRAPSIIYIDEIDAIGKKRNEGLTDGGGEADQTLNQLLVEMDGMTTTSNVILLASTNRGDVLDKALLRPGRFDRHITIDLPTVVERKEILEKHLSGVTLEKDVSQYSQRLAMLTPGFSGADLANLVNEAALHAARTLQDSVKTSNLEYAIERVMAGPEKKTSVISPIEKQVVAYHESGHALVGWMLKHTDALLKVTIIPRTSAALGFAQYTPRDKKLFSPDELMDQMCMALGGRVAESLTFNKITTGAQNDLEKVTKMAYAQINQFGFNEEVGLLSFEQNQGLKPYSKRLQHTMDLEAKKLIAEAYKITEKCLLDNNDKLESLAQLLLEKETLNYSDVEDLLGPPPHGQKRLVNPLDYELSLDEQSKLGEDVRETAI